MDINPYLARMRKAERELQELKLVLNYIGGRVIDGVWHFPFYQGEATAIMMPVQEWIAARKAVGAHDVRALRSELEAIGAIQAENGRWLYPFSLDGSERYLPRDEWIAAFRAHMKGLNS